MVDVVGVGVGNMERKRDVGMDEMDGMVRMETFVDERNFEQVVVDVVGIVSTSSYSLPRCR